MQDGNGTPDRRLLTSAELNALKNQPVGEDFIDVGPVLYDDSDKLAGYGGPRSDIEDIMGRNQSNAERIANGLFNLAEKTGSYTMQGFGYGAALGVNAVNAIQGKEKFIDDAFSRASNWGYMKFFEGLDEKTKEAFPIYKTNAFNNQNVFGKMFNMQFWSDTAVDGLAFMFSSWLSGYTGMGALGLVGKAGRFANIGKLFGTQALASRLGMGSKAMSAITKTMPKLAFNASMTSQEAMFEGADTRKQILEDLMPKVQAGEMTMEEANKIAAKEARDTFLLNMLALTPSNALESSFLLRKGKGSRKGVTYNKLNYVQGADTKFGRFANKYKPAGAILANMYQEGMYEENIQYSIQDLNRFDAYLESEGKDDISFGKKLGQAYKSITPGLGLLRNLRDDERGLNVAMGTVLGVVQGPKIIRDEAKKKKETQEGLDYINKSYSSLLDTDTFERTPDTEIVYGSRTEGENKIYWKKEAGKDEEVMPEDMFQEETKELGLDQVNGGTYKKAGSLVYDENNKPKRDVAKVKKFAESQAYIQYMQNLIDLEENKENPNKRKIDFLYDMSFSKWVEGHLRMGMKDHLKNRIADWKSFTTDDFLAMGYDPNSISVGDMIGRRMAQAEELSKQYDNIEKMFIPATMSKEDRLQNDIRKQKAYEVSAINMYLKDQLKETESELGIINGTIALDNDGKVYQTGKNPHDFDAINRKAYQYQYELIKKAQSELDPLYYGMSDKEINTLENEILELKRRYNESAATPLDLNTEIVRDTESTLNAQQEMLYASVADIQSSIQDSERQWKELMSPSSYRDKFRKRRKSDVLDITDNTSVKQYEDFENASLTRERLRENIENIKKDLSSQEILNDTRETDEILSDIIARKQKIDSRIVDAVKGSIDEKQKELDDIAERHPDVVMGLAGMEYEGTPTVETDDEFLEIQNRYLDIEGKIERVKELWKEISDNGDYYFHSTKSSSPQKLRRNVADNFINEAESTLQIIEKNDTFANIEHTISKAQKFISKLRNIKRIFEKRKEEDRLGSEFNGYIESIDNTIERLTKGLEKLEKVKHDIANQEAEIVHEELWKEYDAIGLDYNAINSGKTIEEAITYKPFVSLLRRLIPEVDTLLGQKEIVALEALYDTLRTIIDEDKKNGSTATIDELHSLIKQRKDGIQDNIVNNFYELKKTENNGYTKDKAAMVVLGSQEFGGIATDKLYDLVWLSGYLDADVSKKGTPMHEYNYSKIYTRFRDKYLSEEGMSSEELSLRKKHIQIFDDLQTLRNLNELLLNVDTTIDMVAHITKEKAIAEKGKKDDKSIYAPTSQQKISLRMIAKWFFSTINGQPFSEMAYMPGYAGTGKTTIVAKWIARLFNINTENTYAVGVSKNSSDTIAKTLFGLNGRTLDMLNDDLRNDRKKFDNIKIILIDEVGQASKENLIDLSIGVQSLNAERMKNGKDVIKVLMLGDPTQMTSTSNFAPIEEVGKEGFSNIKRIPPLTILYRSLVPEVNDTIEIFRSNNEGVDKINSSSNNDNPGNSTSDLFGVNGSKTNTEFLGDIKGIVSNRKGDGRTRLIVTDEQNKAKYLADPVIAEMVANGDVEIMSVYEAQSLTRDEVYVDIQKSGKDPIDFNREMYTAASRAKYYVYFGNIPVAHFYNPDVKPVQEDDEKKRVENLTKYITELDNEKKYLTSGEYSEPINEDKPEEKTGIADVTTEEIKDTNTDELVGTAVDDTEDIDAEYEGALDEDQVTKDEAEQIAKSKSGVIRLFNTVFGIFDKDKGIKIGGKFNLYTDFYVDKENNKQPRVIVADEHTDDSGRTYIREIAVISDKDNIPDEYGTIKEKILNWLSTDSGKLENIEKFTPHTTYGKSNKTFVLESADDMFARIIGSGSIASMQKRRWIFNRKDTTPKKQDIISKYVETLFPKEIYGSIWGVEYNNTIRKYIDAFMEGSKYWIYNDKYIPQGVKKGHPYLAMDNVVDPISGKPRAAEYIKLSFTKITKDNPDYIYLDKFNKQALEIEKLFQKKFVNLKDNMYLGSHLFNELVNRIATDKMQDDYYFGVTGKEGEDRTKALKGLKERIREMSFGIGKPLSDIDISAIANTLNNRANYKEIFKELFGTDIRFSAKETGYIKAFYEMYRIEKDGKIQDGPAMVALNKISKGNKKVKDIILRYKQGKVYVTRQLIPSFLTAEKTADGEINGYKFGLTEHNTIFKDLYDSYIADKKRLEGNNEDTAELKNRFYEEKRALLAVNEGALTRQMLSAVLENYDSIITPTSLKMFRSENVSDDKKEAVMLNTFEGVLPGYVDIRFDDAIVSKRVIPTNIKKKNTSRHLRFTNDKSSLGNTISRERILRYYKRVIQGLNPLEVQFIPMEKIVSLNEGREAWGLYRDGVIYFAEDKDNTYYEKVARHELFHKIWNEFLTNKERENLINDAIQEFPELRRGDNETDYAYDLRLQETLAMKFHNWKTGKLTVGQKIQQFFEWLLQTLNILKPRLNTIEELFTAIERGSFTNRVEPYDGVSLNYSNIDDFSKSHYDSYTIYTKALNYITGVIHDELNPQDDISVENGIIYNLPVKLNEAIKFAYNTLLERREELLDTKDNWYGKNDKESSLNDLEYNIANILTGDGSESITKVFKNIVADIYPSIKFRKNTIKNEEDIPETIQIELDIHEDDDAEPALDTELTDEAESEGIIKTKREEQINYEAKITQRVKDTFSTVRRADGTLIPFKYVYAKMLETFMNFNWDVFDKNSDELWKKFIDRFKRNNRNDIPISERIEPIFFNASRNFNIKFKDIYNPTMEFTTEDTFTINGNSITRNTGESTQDYFKRVVDFSNLEHNVRSYEMISLLMKQKQARETLKEIQFFIGSMYKQNPHKGRLKFIEKQGRTVQYMSEHLRGNETLSKRQIKSNMWSSIHKNGLEKFVSPAIMYKIKNPKFATEKDAYTLFREIGFLNVEENVVITNVPKIFSNMGKIYDELKVEKDNTDMYNKLMFDVDGYLTPITDVIEENLPAQGKSFGYKMANGKKGYLYILSNTTMRVLDDIINFKERRLLPKFLANSTDSKKWFYFNIFNPASKNYNINTIHGFVNHDSMYKDGEEFKSVDLTSEKEEDTLTRIFNYMFVAGIRNHSVSDQKLKYYQPFYNIGERNQAYGVSVNLLHAPQLKAGIKAALLQEVNRDKEGDNKNNKEFQANKGKSYFGSHGTVVKRRENETQDEYEYRLNNIVDIVYSGIINDSKAVYEKVREGLITSDMVKTLGRLNDFGFLKESVPAKWFVSIENRKDAEQQKVWEDRLEKFVKPMVEIFFANYYVNGHFLNQLAVGDMAFTKDVYDLQKRIQIAFSNAHKGIVGGFGMKKNFHVAVGEDIKQVLDGDEWMQYKKVYGMKNEYTDGQGFITPERFEDIKRGFPDSFGLISSIKPVYWNIDEYGRPVALKYSVITLSDELVEKFPSLGKLRENMRKNNVDEFVFNSAVKIGGVSNKVKIAKDGLTHEAIRESNVMELDNNNYGIQLNPKKDIWEDSVKNPTALMYLVNADGKNPKEAKRIFADMATIINLRRTRTFSKLNLNFREEVNTSENKLTYKIRRAILDNLFGTQGLRRIQQFLQSKTDGKYDVSFNIPVLSDKLVPHIASIFDREILELRFNGADLVLESEYGTMNNDKGPLQIRDKDGYAEVYLPDLWKGRFEEGDIIASNKGMFAFRNPSTGKHSALALKVKGFYPSNDNIVIAPKELVLFSGTDFDIDTLFVVRKKIADRDILITDFDGDSIVLFKEGEELSYSEENMNVINQRIGTLKSNIIEAKKYNLNDAITNYFKEYNKLVDLTVDILKNRMIGNYVKVFTDKANDEMMMFPIYMDYIERKTKIEGTDETLVEYLERLKGGTLKETYDPNNVLSQIKAQQDAHGAKMLKGMMVNLSKGLSYSNQSTNEQNILLHDKTHFSINGNVIDQMYREEMDMPETVIEPAGEEIISEEGKSTIEEQVSPQRVLQAKEMIINIVNGEPVKHKFSTIELFDIVINAAIDNMKLQYFSVMNFNRNTSYAFAGLIGSGVSLKTATLIMKQPIIEKLAKEKWVDTSLEKYKKEIVDNIPGALGYKDTVPNINIADLEKFAYKKMNSIVGEDLLVQLAALETFKRATLIGKALNTVSKAAAATQRAESFYSDIVKRLSNFDDIFKKSVKKGGTDTLIPINREKRLYELKDSFPLRNVQILSLPHINQAYITLKSLKTKIENLFYKHNKDLTKFSERVYQWLRKDGAQLNIANFKQEGIQYINNEFIRYLIAGIKYPDGYSFDTTNQQPYIKDGKTVYGVDAWSQEFIERVRQLKITHYGNAFIDLLDIMPNKDGLMELRMPATSVMNETELLSIQKSFEDLMNKLGTATTDMIQVYRGDVANPFEETDITKRNIKFGDGYYFTTNRESADEYRREHEEKTGKAGKLLTSYLDVKEEDLLRIRDDNGDYIKIKDSKLFFQGAENRKSPANVIGDLYDALEEKGVDASRIENIWSLIQKAIDNNIDYIGIAKKYGYKGMVYGVKAGQLYDINKNKRIVSTREGETQYVIFDKENIREGFRAKEYMNMERDFIKYAALTWGLSYGTTNYTSILPPYMFSEITKSLDKKLEWIFDKTNKNFYDNILEHFAIEFSINNINKFPDWNFFDKDIVLVNDQKSGVDVINGKKHIYNRKYKKNDDASYDKYPMILRDGDRMLLKVHDNANFDFVYYVSLGYLDRNKGYQYSTVVEKTGYSASEIHNMDMSVMTLKEIKESVPEETDATVVSSGPSLNVNISQKALTSNVQEGEKILVKTRSDMAGVNAKIYTVGKKEYEDNGTIFMKLVNPEDAIQGKSDNKVTDDLSDKALNVILKNLKQRFNLKYQVLDDDPTGMNRNGWYKGDTVYINRSMVKADTPFHEFMHPILNIIVKQNPELYGKLKKEIDNNKKYKAVHTKVKELYPDYTPDQQYQETIVNIIGNVAADINAGIVNNMTNLIQEIWKRVQGILKDIIGKNKITIGDIPMNITIESLGYFMSPKVKTRFDIMTHLMMSPTDAIEMDMRSYNARVKEWKDANKYYSDTKDKADEIRNNLTKIFGQDGVAIPYYIKNIDKWVINVYKPKEESPAVAMTKEQWLRGLSPEHRQAESIYEMLEAEKEARDYWDSRSDMNVWEDIKKNNEATGLELVETEEDNYYKNNKGNKFKRLTEFVYENFAFAKDIKEIARNKALAYIAGKEKTADGRYKFPDGSEYTFEQLQDKFMGEAEQARLSGKIAHAIIQLMVETIPSKVRDIKYNINEWAIKVNSLDKGGNIMNYFKFLEDNKNSLFSLLGINTFEKDVPDVIRDTIDSELTFYNDDFNMATTIDLAVKHHNDQYSIYDFKAGKAFFDTTYADKLMKYASNGTMLLDTRENRAMLELGFRAFLLKSMYPHMTFRNIQLAHINPIDVARPIDVSMTLVLEMIEQYMLDKSNGMRHLYSKYYLMGLFDPAKYGGQKESINEDADDNNLSYDDKLKKYQNQLSMIQNNIRIIDERIVREKSNTSISIDEKDRTYNKKRRLEERRDDLFDKITAMKQGSESNLDISYEKFDINWWKQYTGVLQYDIAHPLVQILGSMYEKALLGKRTRIQQLNKEYEEMILPVMKEYASSHGALVSPTMSNIGSFFANVNYGDFWSFMWTYKNDLGRSGYVFSTSREYVKQNGTKGIMTDEQWKFSQWIRGKMHKQYNDVMGQKIESLYGPGMTLAKMMGVSEQLLPDFAPRIPMKTADVIERNGVMSKEMTKNRVDSLFDLFTTSIKDDKQPKDIIPLKYMENVKIMEEQNHSFDVEDAFKSFMDNLIIKDEYDSLLSYGTMLKNRLNMKKELGGEELPGLSKFVDDFLKRQILHVRDKAKSKPIVVKNPTTGEDVKVDTYRIAQTLRHGTSLITMPFKIVAPIFNGALATILMVKNAQKGSIAGLWKEKWGIQHDDIDYQMGDLLVGLKEYGKLIWSFISNEKNNKTRLLLERTGMLNDNFDFSTRRNNKIVSKTKIADSSLLYFNYRLFEDFVSMITFIAQMNHAKTPSGKSIYDSYDVKDGKLVWTGGVRGNIKMASGDIRTITELTEEEVSRMKRVYQIDQGGYKEEEKQQLEQYAGGLLALQFRRYLPAIMNNIGSRKYADQSLSKFTVRFDENGNPIKLNGETELELTKRLYEGKIRTLAGITALGAGMLLNKIGINANMNMKYSWKELSPEQKKQLIDIALIGMIAIGYMVAKGPDDDEPDSAVEKRMTRLFTEDLTQGMNPMDLFKNIERPFTALGKVKDFYLGWSMWLKGKDDDQEHIPGRAYRMKSLPFVSMLYELEKYGDGTIFMYKSS